MDKHSLQPNRTYMVVGGVRGFGFEVGRWMAKNGAKSIVLVSRSPPSDDKKQEVAAIEKKTGAQIFLYQADISVPSHVEALEQVKLNDKLVNV